MGSEMCIRDRVTDQSGVWAFAGGDLETWRQVVGGAPDAVPLYPG